MSPATAIPIDLVTRPLAPGVRLHVVRTPRFTTTLCRVVMARDLGPEAAATAVLGQVLQSATARHTTRRALSERLADLYGAALHVGVTRLGDRQLLGGSLEWPTAYVTRGGHALGRGLRLLREVLAEPLLDAAGTGFDPALVRTETRNHVRALRAEKNDKPTYALRRLLGGMCADEPFGTPVGGRVADVPGITPEGLLRIHRALLRRAPVEIFLVGDVAPAAAEAAVRRHLLWPERAGSVARVPPAASVRPARDRVRHRSESAAITQGRLVIGWRGAIGARTRLSDGAATLAGILGGGAYSRMFKVLREEHGLCYDASAQWIRSKGILVVQTGIEGGASRRVRQVVRRLFDEVASGVLHESALEGYRQDQRHRFEGMSDNRGALVAWLQHAIALGLPTDPDAHTAALERVTPSTVRSAAGRLSLDSTFFLRPRAP